MRWVWISVAVIAGLVGVIALVGALLPKSHVASRSARFRQPPEALWQAITDIEAFPTWRTDLKSVKRLPDPAGRGRLAWVETSKFGEMPLEVVEFVPPRRLVTRIADPKLPFGGTWTYEIASAEGGSVLTVTENGEIYNPIFRFLARFVFGYRGTMDTSLKALGKKFGEAVHLEE